MKSIQHIYIIHSRNWAHSHAYSAANWGPVLGHLVWLCLYLIGISTIIVLLAAALLHKTIRSYMTTIRNIYLIKSCSWSNDKAYNIFRTGHNGEVCSKAFSRIRCTSYWNQHPTVYIRNRAFLHNY